MAITRINNNLIARNATRNLYETGNALQTSIERLSSGLRVNNAGDDAAGLLVAKRLNTQFSGMTQAIANAQDGLNLISIAEGALEETTTRLNRIRVLAVQAGNTGVNDLAARRALQDEVFQSVDEITRIASSTQFNSNFVLNGDFSVKTAIKDGQVDAGFQIDASPVASTLESGSSYLNIIKLSDENHKLVSGDAAGGQQNFSLGLVEGTDVAISNGHFGTSVSLGAANATGATVIGVSGNAFFNNVSIVSGDDFTFSGVLADGVTAFAGALSVDAATTAAGLASAINVAISAAEAALFGSTVDTGFDISAAFGAGRITLTATDGDQSFSLASIDIGLVRAGVTLTEKKGVTHSTFDSASSIGYNAGYINSGTIGNSVSSLTGSTFDSGQFTITVEDVQGAQQRVVQSTVAFTDLNGTILQRGASLASFGAINGRLEGAVYTGYSTLNLNTTVDLVGTNADGTTFGRSFVLTGAAADDANTEDGGKIASISGLIKELNSRKFDASGNQQVFNDGVATFSAEGTIQVIDEFGRNDSQTNFTLTFNVDNANAANNPVTISDDSVLLQEGFEEQATVRIDSGPSVRVNAGDVVTLYGAESTIDGIPTPEVTMRVGENLTAGTDTFETTASEYVGSLNGGTAITFSAGDQDVAFLDGRSTQTGSAKTVTVDFDNIINVTRETGGLDAGTSIILSTTNTSMNFQIGGNAGQNFRVSVGDLRSGNLGFGEGSGRTLSNLDITSLDGVNEALAIIDEAMGQVNRTRSLLGAATNRLESTVSNLSVTAENLKASESRIMDADLAVETTEFTLRQVQLQAGISVLAQSNFQTQSLLALLG